MTPARSKFPLTRGPRLFFALAAGFLVFASRTWLLRTFGSPLPFWDEWDAEPPLYRAWLQGTLTWQQLLAPHNEHRILLTRLADLALFILHGEWNVWSQLILNAVLHSTTAALITGLLWNGLNRAARITLATGVVLLFSAPSGWQNALFGFQSQVYFTSLLCVLACAMTLRSEPLSRRWWVGFLAAIVALGSNAGGALIAPSLLAGTLLLSPPAFTTRRLIAAILLTALFGFALLTRVTHPGHVPFQAHTATQFLGTLMHGLSWPHISSAWWWILLQAPVVLLLISRLSTNTSITNTDRCAFALVVFAALHAAAIAYSRGGGLRGFQLLSRYQDPMLLGAAAQLYAALSLALRHGRAGRLALIGWAGVAAFGLLQLSEAHLTLNLPYKRAMDRSNFAAARAFLDAPTAERPRLEAGLAGLHPEPATVKGVLGDPLLQPILPRLLRAELADDAAMPPGIILHGAWISTTIAGACLMLAAITARRSSDPAGNTTGR